ncbi:MAG: hypothetical protein ACYC5N_05270, partial [Endomicrobiales bacterium]
EEAVGQANPVSGDPNWGGAPAANTLSGPVGVMADRAGNVWVADSANNRILRYSSAVVTGCDAALVLGQADFTHTGSDFLDGRTITPRSVAVDAASGRLYAADPGNNRVLWWDSLDGFANGKSADGVLGQPDLYSNAANRGGTVKANTLHAPSGVEVDGQGDLWVADRDNHRVLKYPAPVTSGMDAGVALGQADLTSGTAATAQNRMNAPNCVRLDGAGDLWVADTGNNRVLKFTARATGANAALELGQANFGAGNANQGLGAPAANTLSGPCGIAVDSGGNVFVADRDNNRVLYFSTPAVNGTNADKVFGKDNFTVSAPVAVASNALSAPTSVELDAAGILWVADSAYHRVLGYRAPFTTKMVARQVLGQPNYTSGAANRGLPVAADGLSSPSDIRTDAAGNLWIADSGNNRLVKYNAFLISSVTPPRGANTGPVTITELAGQEFLPGYVVRLKRTGETDVTATWVNAPETGKLSCVFDLTGTATGLWTIEVSTGSTAGAFSCALADGFTVAPLSVSSISPARGDNDRTMPVTLSGEGFVAGTQVRLTRAGYAPISAASATVVDGGTLLCSFDLAGAATGTWNLVVTTNTFTFTLTSGYEIRFPVDYSQSIDPASSASVVLKAEAGNITVEVPDGAFSEQVTLTVALAATPAVTRETLKPTALCMDITNDKALQPRKDMTLIIRYRDSDVAGLDETKLSVCRYDAARGHWAVIPSTPVPSENYVTASLNHLSRFALLQVAAATTVNDAGVYPNPYSPVRHASGMVFENLPLTAEIRIYTILGEFISRVPYESRDGRALWRGKNEAGETVASGVYIALIKSPEGTKKVKLAVEK